MKKNWSSISFLLAIILVFSTCAPAMASGSLIADPNLEQAVKESLWLDEGEELTKEKLNDLEWLWGGAKGIKNLSGLENAKNLLSVEIPENEVSDLTPLKDLDKLYRIDISSNKVSTIDALSNLSFSGYRGGEINLSHNSISDIKALGTMSVTNYVYLDLSHNKIKSLDVLKNVTKVTKLYASNNQINSTAVLKNMTDLTHIDLSHNQLTNLDGVSVTDDVYYFLNFSDNKITDISSLKGLKNAELNLSNNNISDVSSLKGLENGTLDLKGNPLSSESEAVLKDLKKRGLSVEYDPIVKRDVERVSGKTRYSTAVEISKSGWTTAETVIIARGNDFPDALSGASLAYKLNAPILLTGTAKLDADTSAEIKRLKAKKAIILGGKSAVSDKTVKEIKDLGLTVERIAGADRYETAKLIADKLGGKPDTAIVTYGKNFPDALAVASYAAQNGYPILLTDKDKLPTQTKEVVKGMTKTIVIGGEGAVSKKVASDLPGVERIGGLDRFETASNIVRKLNMSTEKVYVANGRGFADALTGSVLAAKQSAPLLLVEKDKVPAHTTNLLNEKGNDDLVILGGEGAVSASVAKKLEN